MLLAAVREAFGDEDRISTAELLERINADEELPFGGWRDGKGLDGRKLARLLRPYKVRPDSIRPHGSDRTVKGYLREWFADAWQRWLPTLPTEAERSEQAERRPQPGTPVPLEQAKVPLVPPVPPVSGGCPTGERNGNGVIGDEERAAARMLGLNPFDEAAL